ncbi:PLDc N-terminal domain-containing protein [Brevibacillus humidisoli]|uniref:PLDc N-terminal domain-containing protein n=1 Tax=Brevibacillus humidisoli TaxID=2895522 RepID=UPI001E30AB1A|nr:PLDc N-terminal domain-containing protein [Brevibacillus humidisoli]UFJ41370.1 PLDc N-terminal domain-containing protein [Brevibacillus humidisoli]
MIDFMVPFGFALIPLLIILFLYLLNIITSIWAYRDARRRGNSKEYALIVLVGTLIFPIAGLIVYLVIRND